MDPRAPAPARRHSALTAPLLAAAAGLTAGAALWVAGERDAYAPPLLALGLWALWRLPAGRARRVGRGALSALYALGGAALLWERSAAHAVWEPGTDRWAHVPESLTLKTCAALLALSWLAARRLTPRPPPPPSEPPP
ncbi:MAG: hypothetical protein FJ138_18135 [Deltaproteobacteria bacterium]|nr:hypothetical protein [Deltaproteobacteria bacterium]